MPATPGSRRLSPRNQAVLPFLQGVPRYPFPIIRGRDTYPALTPRPPTQTLSSQPARVAPPVRPTAAPAAAGPPPRQPPAQADGPAPLRAGSALARTSAECQRRLTAAQVLRWLTVWDAHAPHVQRVARLSPSLAAFCGFPLFAFWGLESSFRLDAANRRELAARRSTAGAVSGSWGIGQVIDANFPSLYGELRRSSASFPPFSQPPTLNADAIRGLDLSSVGTGLSGLAYSLMWVVRASRAYDQMMAAGPNTRNRDIAVLSADWKTAVAGLPDHIARGLWLRVWGGASNWRGARTQLRAAKTVQRLACLRAINRLLVEVGSPMGRPGA